MRVAVVGGAGYIGSHVVLALQDAGMEPIIFDNLSTGLHENIESTGATFFQGDITDKNDLKKFFSVHPVDAVVHLAAKKAVGESMQHPEMYSENNINGAILLLNAMQEHGVQSIVFSSSAAVYGTPQQLPITEEHPLGPDSFYGYTKVVIEEILGWYAELAGIRYAALRYFNAVGYDPDGRVRGRERNPQNLFPILFEAAIGERDSVTIFGADYDTEDGTCIRDYIHVADLAAAHVQALNKLESTAVLVLNLGTGTGLSVHECVEAVMKHTQAFTVVNGARRSGDPPVVYADATKAHDLLGWKPQYSDLDTIVRSTKRVYKKMKSGQ